MTSHQLLSPAGYRRMPWKNGSGRTAEIASHPPGSDFATFLWRASIAEVERDGPFSVLPGVDRILVLLSGGGVRLTGEGEPIVLRLPLEPVAFAGDVPLTCELLSGSVRDFNLMLRRGRAQGAITVVRDEAVTVAPARFALCYAAVGASECLLAGHAPLHIAEGQTLIVEGEPRAHRLHVNPATAHAAALVATIDLR
jgi:environmental stress-induced protein Ves